MIWYVTADSYAAARNSPQIEALKARDIEVLLLSDRIDEWIDRASARIRGQEAAQRGQGRYRHAGCHRDREAAGSREGGPKASVAKLKALLGDRVSDVRVSHRLTDSPSVLVLGEQ